MIFSADETRNNKFLFKDIERIERKMLEPKSENLFNSPLSIHSIIILDFPSL